MKRCEVDLCEVVKRSKIDFNEEFRKTLQDEITKAVEEADKAKIEKCKELAHKNMKQEK